MEDLDSPVGSPGPDLLKESATGAAPEPPSKEDDATLAPLDGAIIPTVASSTAVPLVTRTTPVSTVVVPAPAKEGAGRSSLVDLMKFAAAAYQVRRVLLEVHVYVVTHSPQGPS